MTLRTLLGRVLLLSLLLGTAPAGAEELRVVLTPRSVPFSYLDANGELTGFNVDVARAICAQLGRTCRLETAAFADIIPAVAAGRYDLGAANFLRTPEREREVAFTVPFWRSASVFVGKAGRPMKTVGELLGEAQVCAVAGSAQQRYLSGQAGEHAANVRMLPTGQDLLEGLASGACQVALLPAMQALPFIKTPQGAGLAFLGTPLREHGLGGSVHMVVRRGDDALRTAVDHALHDLIASGEHERLARRYFPFSIL
ncbi:substrate-binding periplasmic protein [Pseudothauera rhizosphaerae]|nr:transporter substrate-binding domain-containing protein [Pseudothauera rhizosphaerae]